MTTNDLNQLLTSKTFRAEFEISDHGLRIFLQDKDGNCALLAIEPRQYVLPDETLLDYSWQDVSTELGPPPEECLIMDLKTNTEPDFPKGSVPFLFD